ncbi:MAG TPA: AAA family ATPase [Longimicrobiaceae bacterium]|nr:AAA family ATPase [Longimicrobiaceae bacterium]
MKKRFLRVREALRPRRARVILCLVLLVLAGAAGGAVWWLRPSPAAVPEVAYSDLAALLEARGVREVVVRSDGARLDAKLNSPVRVAGTPVREVEASMPAGSLTLQDIERWSAHGTRVRVEDSAPRGGTPIGLLLAIFVGVGIVALLFRAQRGAMSRRFGTAPETQLTLSDVGGAREAQADLRDVISFLRDPGRFDAMGAQCPKGVLLVGPPGTGKTLLARAVAGESGRPVLIASGSEFTEMYVGVGARRVRDLVKQARAKAPCIVFIDEFDSLGGRRGRPNRSSEEESTLNQLLVEMDGLRGSEGIVWMAATNREDMLDPAVRRPGRFDRVVEVGLPTAPDRLDILRIHAARRPMAPDIDLERLAALTVGYSGADLANLLNEAAIIAVQAGSSVIEAEHVEQARDKILLGRVRAGVVVSDHERRLVAVHEAGHVITGLVACPEDRFHKVTIEPRGRSLGAAHFAPDADRHLYSRRYLEGILVKALGGRAAELTFLGPDAVTSGAGADLVQATRVARQMVAEFGMSDEVGLVSASPAAQDGPPSAQLQGQIDAAVRVLIAKQMERSEAIVREHRGAVEAIARALVEHTVLSAEDVTALAALHGVPVDDGMDEELEAFVA